MHALLYACFDLACCDNLKITWVKSARTYTCDVLIEISLQKLLSHIYLRMHVVNIDNSIQATYIIIISLQNSLSHMYICMHYISIQATYIIERLS